MARSSATARRFTPVPSSAIAAGWARTASSTPTPCSIADVILGDRVEVHAGTVLGGDGFGYRQIDGRHVKIPHTGRLEVDNDVEIGSNCTIDRATFETTRIGEGTKIDNLVMIGHNNQIGRHNLLCGQVGIAGSCKTGDYVVMAGQAGIKDNTQIGDRVIVGAQAGVHRNIPDGQNVLGSPAIPVREQRRLFQMIARLPEMHRAASRACRAARRRWASVDPRRRTRLRTSHGDGWHAGAGARLVSATRRSDASSIGNDRAQTRLRSRASTDRPARGKRPVSDPLCPGGPPAGSTLWRASESNTKRPKSCGLSAIRSSWSESPSSAG